jgi:hypothetical protein
MPDRWGGLTLDEVRARLAAAGIEIAEARLDLVQKLVNMALEPIRSANWRGLPDVEPAVRFDARPTLSETRP